VDWRVKALGHWAISILPRSDDLGYLMQRKITRSLPLADEAFADHVDVAARHLATASSLLGRDVRAAYEFGAGWDLVIPFAMARAGLASQTLTDVRPLARPELIADTAARLGMQPDLERLGITYLAPVDAMSTGLPSGAFDLITSTDTLEHVPAAQLPALLAECRRLLSPDGIFSARIDYRDHYAYADSRLGAFHFLRYGPRAWRVWNPQSHFQSRLRHSDHLNALRAAGFDVIEASHPDPNIQALGDVHASFRGYVEEDLAIPEAWIVARPGSSSLAA
jgi:SAM-dependent methyltransferase